MSIRESRLVDAYAVKLVHLKKQIRAVHLVIESGLENSTPLELQTQIVESGELTLKYRETWEQYVEVRRVAQQEPVPVYAGSEFVQVRNFVLLICPN